MTIIKKSLIFLVCLCIVFTPVLSVNNTQFSYASDNWEAVSDSNKELILKACELFLKAHSFTYKYSISGAFNTWSYEELERKCADHGITMTELSQGLQYQVNNGKYSFLYSSGVAQALNNLWTHLMQDYGLTANTFKTIYSGKYWQDPNGNKVLCFVADSTNIASLRTDIYDHITGFGQKYLHSGSELKSLSSIQYKYSINDTVTFNIQYSSAMYGAFIYIDCYGVNSSNNIIYSDNGTYQSYDCIVYKPSNNTYTLCTYCDIVAQKTIDGNTQNVRVIKISRLWDYWSGHVESGNADVQAHQGDTDSNIPTDKPVQIDETDDEPEVIIPTEPPSQQPVPPDSVTPNPENPTINPGNSDFNFQMPDININWNLGFDGENMPFPFSIPYDLKRAFEMVNVEPETPRFQGTVDLIVCEWDIDIDFTPYDGLANTVSKWLLFIYIIGLIVATRSIMHIY